jgi:hypothetical protein
MHENPFSRLSHYMACFFCEKKRAKTCVTTAAWSSHRPYSLVIITVFSARKKESLVRTFPFKLTLNELVIQFRMVFQESSSGIAENNSRGIVCFSSRCRYSICNWNNYSHNVLYSMTNDMVLDFSHLISHNILSNRFHYMRCNNCEFVAKFPRGVFSEFKSRKKIWRVAFATPHTF